MAAVSDGGAVGPQGYVSRTCDACRARKVSCDLLRPICSACRKYTINHPQHVCSFPPNAALPGTLSKPVVDDGLGTMLPGRTRGEARKLRASHETLRGHPDDEEEEEEEGSDPAGADCEQEQVPHGRPADDDMAQHLIEPVVSTARRPLPPLQLPVLPTFPTSVDTAIPSPPSPVSSYNSCFSPPSPLETIHQPVLAVDAPPFAPVGRPAPSSEAVYLVDAAAPSESHASTGLFNDAHGWSPASATDAAKQNRLQPWRPLRYGLWFCE